MLRCLLVVYAFLLQAPRYAAFQPMHSIGKCEQSALHATSTRREWVSGVAAVTAGTLLGGNFAPQPAEAVGPVKINLLNPTYTAIPCPKDKPVPGEKAMLGMKPMCVTVDVDLENQAEKALDKIGVYGFVTDKATGESVLANNPDLSTDAGQFAIIPEIKTSDKKVQFEFIAAVPKDVVRIYTVKI